MLKIILAGLVGYLVGAPPTAWLVCKALRREGISFPLDGWDIWRMAGAGVGIFTAAVDCLLGAAAVIAAGLLTDEPWAATLAGVMAVAGHNWSPFIRFGGGRGLFPLAGVLLAMYPGFALSTIVGLLIIGVVLMRFLRLPPPRAVAATMLFIGPLLAAMGAPLHAIACGVIGGVLVIVRMLPEQRLA